MRWCLQYCRIFSFRRPMAGTGNSSIQIRQLVDDARTFGDIAPVLPTGGFSLQPALSIVNDTMTAMLVGSPDGEPFNWKWNRIIIPRSISIPISKTTSFPALSILAGWSPALRFTRTYRHSPRIFIQLKFDATCWKQVLRWQTAGWRKFAGCRMTQCSVVCGVNPKLIHLQDARIPAPASSTRVLRACSHVRQIQLRVLRTRSEISGSLRHTEPADQPILSLRI